MTPRHGTRYLLIVFACVLFSCLMNSQVRAQTWVPPKGRGLVILNYQFLNVSDHLFSNDLRFDLGDIKSHSLLMGLDLALTNRLGVSGAVAFVSSRYEGPFPESSIDEGDFNSGFQDASVGARYMVLIKPFVATPFVSFGFPTHNYTTIGHTAVGRNLTAFTLGLGIGRDFDPLLPNGYFQATYAYSFVEDVGDFNLDTNSLYFELGYFVLPQLSVRGFGNYFNTVGGQDWLELTSEHFHTHDQAAKTESFVLGGGLGYQLSYSWGAFASLMTTIDGSNTHDASSINIGTNYYFSLPF